jgi:hypothetical protein
MGLPWTDSLNLRCCGVSLGVELIKSGQVEDAKRMLKVAIKQDPKLRAGILDHPGPEEVWWP